jgi:hypothetical protein
MQRLRVCASCWAFLARTGANGFVVAIASTVAAGSLKIAAIPVMVLAQTFGAPVLLGYLFQPGLP